jgi:hypothetical protein
MVPDDFRRIGRRESDGGMTDEDLDAKIQDIKLAREELTPEQEARLVEQLLRQPMEVDLQDRCGPVADRGLFPSSVGHAAAAGIQLQSDGVAASRQFMYWNARSVKDEN